MEKKVIERLKRVHYGIMARCYREGSSGYENYGAKGVHVTEKWHTFEGFLEDVPYIEGWDEDRYVKDMLSLDKDKEWGNKEYSLDKCRFVTPEENNQVKPNQQYRIVGMSPDKKVYNFTSANGFAKEHGLSYSDILKVAKGEYKQTKGWQFCLEDEIEERPFVEPYSWERYIIGLSPEGETYRFFNASEFARENNLLEATVIYGCANLKNSNTRGWQFRFEGEVERYPFKDPKKLKTVKTRGKEIVAISPEGTIHRTNNRTQFAKENNINRAAMADCLKGKRGHYKGWKFYEKLDYESSNNR